MDNIKVIFKAFLFSILLVFLGISIWLRFDQYIDNKITSNYHTISFWVVNCPYGDYTYFSYQGEDGKYVSESMLFGSAEDAYAFAKENGITIGVHEVKILTE